MENKFDAINKLPPDQRYAVSCRIIFDVLSSLKLKKQEKIDVLADITCVLDGVQPSERSGFIKG